MDGYKYRFIQMKKRTNKEEIIAHNYKYIYFILPYYNYNNLFT